MKKFICDGEKYILSGRQVGNTITLPVSFSTLPEKLDIEGYTLIRKEEFHVSLVCIGKIIEQNHIIIPDFINKVIEDFCDFIRTRNIEVLQYRNEFKLVSQLDRRTVVVMCDVSNLEKFFDLLNQKYNLSLEYPPTHVTLYTLQPNVGIFLTNSDDIRLLTRSIEAPVKL